jgi:hypothetical protein
MSEDYPSPVPSVPTIEADPGNADVDSFNILIAAVDRDWRSIRDIVRTQDRMTNEATLMRTTVWLSIILRSLPDEVRLMFLNSFRNTILEDL